MDVFEQYWPRNSFRQSFFFDDLDSEPLDFDAGLDLDSDFESDFPPDSPFDSLDFFLAAAAPFLYDSLR